MKMKLFFVSAMLFFTVGICKSAHAQEVVEKSQAASAVTKSDFTEAVNVFEKAGVKKENFEALNNMMIKVLGMDKHTYAKTKDAGDAEATRSSFNNMRLHIAIYKDLRAQIYDSEIIDANKVMTQLHKFSESL